MRCARIGHVTRTVLLGSLAGSVVLAAACSLTTSLSGLSDGDPSDAAAGETGSSLGDASPEAASSDAGADANGDSAADTGDAAPGPFCERNASLLFCADFDMDGGSAGAFGFDTLFGGAQV